MSTLGASSFRSHAFSSSSIGPGNLMTFFPLERTAERQRSSAAPRGPTVEFLFFAHYGYKHHLPTWSSACRLFRTDGSSSQRRRLEIDEEQQVPMLSFRKNQLGLSLYVRNCAWPLLSGFVPQHPDECLDDFHIPKPRALLSRHGPPPGSCGSQRPCGATCYPSSEVRSRGHAETEPIPPTSHPYLPKHGGLLAPHRLAERLYFCGFFFNSFLFPVKMKKRKVQTAWTISVFASNHFGSYLREKLDDLARMQKEDTPSYP